MMPRAALTACKLVAAVIFMTDAHAQVTIDMSRVTCDQFLGYKIIHPDEIAMWLSGYYNGQRGNTTIDTETLNTQKRSLQDYCLRNPNVPIMQAIEKLFHK
jgi:acid stress chaperone HdeB